MDLRVIPRFEVLPDADAVAREAARSILVHAADAAADRGRFRVVLAGGSTPLAAYRFLAGSDSDWGCWEIYFGDERCLPRDDPGRNSLAAREALLDTVPIPSGQIFEIPAELGAETAAEAYSRIVSDALPFDLVLLGMGEDGHTASLFPDHPVDRDALVVPVHDAPKPPADRVSLSLEAIARSRYKLILVTGTGKREALAAWRRGADLPVARAAASGARVLVDSDASGA